MKRIDAIIRGQGLEPVKSNLAKIGIEGMTVAEVKGSGHQKQTESYRGSQYQIDYFPKLLLTIIASDEQVPGILDAIVKGARTGKAGDGKIFVAAIDEVVRIRNGAIDEAAV